MDLGEGLRKAVARLTGATIIDAKTIREFNKELQRSLISADVNVELVVSLTKKLEDAALREKLPDGVSGCRRQRSRSCVARESLIDQKRARCWRRVATICTN